MKKSTLLLIVLFLSFNLFAQKGISFQGIARDPQGNAITNENISVKFTIGSFSETQNISTDDFGVFSATIGSVETADFNNLVFANNDYFLKVDIDGTTIYNDKFNAVPYAKSANNGVPVGSIIPWAGAVTSGAALEEPIAGWVVCNGATLSTDIKYDELKTVLGNAWGTNKVPDLRGTFLRGVNNGRSDDYKDPDVADRQAVNSGNIGDNVGSFQRDEFGSHSHPANANTVGDHNHLVNGDAANGVMGTGDDDDGGDRVLKNSDGAHDGNNENTEGGGSHTHTITLTNSGGSESRPVNAGVNFIIKY